jgi:anti-sigma B factor antagonist
VWLFSPIAFGVAANFVLSCGLCYNLLAARLKLQKIQEVTMEITTEQLKRCDLLRVAGRIDSSTAPQLNQAFEAIQEEGHFRVVFDMSQVDFVSSAGLRVLINAQKTCKRWNRGEVVLAAVPPQIHEVLDLAGFLPLFRIYDDVVQAVGSF